MGLYDFASSNEFCVKIVRGLKNIKKEKVMNSRLRGTYRFVDRRKNFNKMCIILAGYKQFLWFSQDGIGF